MDAISQWACVRRSYPHHSPTDCPHLVSAPVCAARSLNADRSCSYSSIARPTFSRQRTTYGLRAAVTSEPLSVAAAAFSYVRQSSSSPGRGTSSANGSSDQTSCVCTSSGYGCSSCSTPRKARSQLHARHALSAQEARPRRVAHEEIAGSMRRLPRWHKARQGFRNQQITCTRDRDLERNQNASRRFGADGAPLHMPHRRDAWDIAGRPARQLT